MSLRVFTPSLPLQSYLRSFITIDEPYTVFNQRITMPDSYPVIFINFGAPFVWDMENGSSVELPRAIFVGLQTKPLKIRATGWCQAVGLVLLPWAIRLFVADGVDLAAKPIIPLNGVWDDFIPLLRTTISQRGDTEAFALLGQFISDMQIRNRFDMSAFRSAFDTLRMTNGRFNMHEFAAQSHLSTSQLERHSKYFTGISPKTLSRLIRFDAVCAGLTDFSSKRMTDLAYQYGFTDQAHFIHEFKAFAACTPRQAAAYIRQITADAEFLQFS